MEGAAIDVVHTGGVKAGLVGKWVAVPVYLEEAVGLDVDGCDGWSGGLDGADGYDVGFGGDGGRAVEVGAEKPVVIHRRGDVAG